MFDETMKSMVLDGDDEQAPDARAPLILLILAVEYYLPDLVKIRERKTDVEVFETPIFRP